MKYFKEYVYYTLFGKTGRFSIPVDLKDKQLDLNKQINFLVDTGASTVCLPARLLNLSKQQEYFIKSTKSHDFVGLINNKSVTYYRYDIATLSVGSNITIKDFPIYITFESNVDLALLGMSFLKLFNIAILTSQKLLILMPFNQKTQSITTGKVSLKNIKEFDDSIFIVDEQQFDIQELEANEVSKLIEHLQNNT